MSEEKISEVDMLKQKILEQQKIINTLKKDNQMLMESNIDTSVNNTIIIKELSKLLRIVYGLSDIINYQYNDVVVYGQMLENILTNKSLYKNTLRVFIKKFNEVNFLTMCERLNDYYTIKNTDYNIKKVHNVIFNQELIIIDYWRLKIVLFDDFEITIELHNKTYMEELLFNSQNLVLHRLYGLGVREITKDDVENKINNPSLSLLGILSGFINNKVNILNKNISHTDNINLIKYMTKQNDYIKEGYEVESGFINNECKDEHCGICYREHREEESFLYNLSCSHTFCSECIFKTITTDSVNSNNCPLCRRRISFDMK